MSLELKFDTMFSLTFDLLEKTNMYTLSYLEGKSVVSNVFLI